MPEYLIIRQYRGKRRPLLITSDREEANRVYEENKKVLRDGDISLFEVGEMKPLAVAPGGYNRTRW